MILMGVLIVALAGCGGSDDPGSRLLPEEFPDSTVSIPTATPVFYASGSTLMVPTHTPNVETRSALPRADRASGDERTRLPVVRPVGDTSPLPATKGPGGTVLPQVHSPDHTPGPTEITLPEEIIREALVLSSPSCIDDFRQMLLNYDGVEEFGPEVAGKISDRLVGRRPDCLEQGWAPVFGIEPDICVDIKVGGYKVGFNEGKYGAYRLKPTMRNIRKMPHVHVQYMLVHFKEFPFLEPVDGVMPGPGQFVGGCWYYEGLADGGGRWYWNKYLYELRPRDDGKGLFPKKLLGYFDTGVDQASFPHCERLLRSLLEVMVSEGVSLDTYGVAGAIDRVREMEPGCNAAWGLFPAVHPAPGCPGSLPTGSQADGSLVVNWERSFPDAFGGSACWVLSPEGEWGFYARVPDGGG